MPKRNREADVCWLLNRTCPETETPTTGEMRLWWAVIRAAAHDLRYSHASCALDALEFLRDTGVWLLTELFLVDVGEARRGVVSLVIDRNRYHREPLDDNAVRLPDNPTR